MQITHLWSGGLITNYYCSSRCAHCLYACSTSWEKKYITAETTEANLIKIKSLGCHSIHIGGGEPFLNLGGLVRVLEIAQQVGMAIEYVETNSSWFMDVDSAVEILAQLQKKGVSTLLISISPFHNEYIPFFKVKGVMAACRKIGMGIFPWINDFYDEIDAFDDRRAHKLREYIERYGEHYVKRAAYRYYLAIRGRALSLLRPYQPARPLADILNASSAGCHELSDVSHFHLDPYGNYIPGLCAGLSIHRDDLGHPLKTEDYPFLTALYSQGIKALLRMTKEEYGFMPKEYYLSKCDVCQDIRRFLVLAKMVDSPDLQPREFYKHL